MGPPGTKIAGNMPEAQGRHRQSGHDLVADPEIERAIEHVVAERHGCRQRDDVARKQGQFHAGLTLSDAIAHGGDAARELSHSSAFVNRLLDDGRKALEGLMRAQHIVVGGDDRNVDLRATAERLLVVHVASGKAVGEVAAGEMRSPGRRWP